MSLTQAIATAATVMTANQGTFGKASVSNPSQVVKHEFVSSPKGVASVCGATFGEVGA